MPEELVWRYSAPGLDAETAADEPFGNWIESMVISMGSQLNFFSIGPRKSRDSPSALVCAGGKQ